MDKLSTRERPTAVSAVSPLKVRLEQGYVIDVNLPHWARRSHPIVQRHLGRLWRVMPPQIDSLMQYYLLQAGVVLLSIPIPFLLTLLLPLTLLSLFVLPTALFYYGRALYQLASDASESMVMELENHTMPLLRVSPMSTREILRAKLAASLWRQSDPLGIVLFIAATTQLPFLILVNMNAYETQGVFMQAMVLAGLASSILRLPLEMAMVAAMGQYIGVTTRGKGTAAASTLTLMLFYFALINAPRLAALSAMMDLLVNVVLPVSAPLLLAVAFLKLTEREVEQG